MSVDSNTEHVSTPPGQPAPLGPTWDGDGTNFALFSEHASGVTLCLFDEDGNERPVPLTEVTAHVWHGYLPGVGPGQQYGYRVDGPYSPEEGHRFDPAKLLVDPYAKALAGTVNWEAPVFGYVQSGDPDADLHRDDQDSGWGMSKSLVVDPGFDWEDTRPPATPLHRSVIYEVHVKGFTEQHPDIEPEIRGTYAALTRPPAIEHLQKLGITAVELLPVHASLTAKHLADQGLTNYWGYNTLNFFAPEARYSSGGDRGEQVREFKEMVKALHQAGIEVILDVVYNHTAEGNHMGPTLSFRGIDNASYYRLVENDLRYYMDYTGTGNTLNARNPQTLQLIMDSLRYWVLEMHVDGFRFDLASIFVRNSDGSINFDDPMLTADVMSDPGFDRLRLIAEPWDAAGLYQLGRSFPAHAWFQWNGRFRDDVRRFVRGEP